MVEYGEPRHPQVWFGDAHWCQLIKKMEYPNEQGVIGWLLILRPSLEVIREYNLKYKDDMDEYGYVRRWYPKSVVRILRDDPVMGKVLILVDFVGKPTDLSRMVEEYTTIIDDQQKLIKALKGGNARKARELEIALTQAEKFVTKTSTLIESVKKKTGGSEQDEGYGMEAPGGPG